MLRRVTTAWPRAVLEAQHRAAGLLQHQGTQQLPQAYCQLPQQQHHHHQQQQQRWLCDTPTPRGRGHHQPEPSTQTHSGVNDQPIGIYTPVTKQLWQERLRLAAKHQPRPGAAPPAVGPPAPRAPAQTAISYPFTSDRMLLELYRSPWGYLRIGRLLEDLDSLAGSIAFSHCLAPDGARALPLLVTVAVDAIELAHPVTLTRDAACRGQVVFTGGSSLDIRMELLQEPHAPAPSLVALFSFVLLDPATNRPTAVPPLAPQTEQEHAWAAERAAIAAQRKQARHASKERGGKHILPASSQAYLDEAIAAATLMTDLPALADPAWISPERTSLSNTFVCQPQQRNMHGRIFGGFLMRRAFELAFATTYLFAGSRPGLVRVDEVTFRSPVDVGSLLRFTSHVVDVSYHPLRQQPQPPQQQEQQEQQQQEQQEQTQQQQTLEAHVAVEVSAVVSRPEQRDTTHTNTFRYVFRVALEAGQRLRRVVPSTAADVERLTRHLADDA